MTNKTLFADTAELCAQIMVMAIEITRGGRYHVFAEYLGHVNCLDVRVLPGSQVYTADVPHEVLHKATIYLNRDHARERMELEIGALNDLASVEAA